MDNMKIAERLGFTGGGRVEKMFKNLGFSSKNMTKREEIKDFIVRILQSRC